MDLAAEDNKPEIVQILLETDDLRDESRSHGALHYAIHHQMFEVVKSSIEKGYDLNEYFMDKTPLGASLNCAKARSGDARLVKRLLDAKADMRKQSKLCITIYGDGERTELVNVARAYSNSKCVALIDKAYHTRTN